MSNNQNYDRLVQNAFLALQQGQAVEAAQIAKTLTEQRPDDAEGWSILGLAVADDTGMSALERAVALEPREPRWRLHLGLGLFNRQKYSAAQEVLAQAAELSRGHPEIMTAWAETLMKLQRFGDAAQIYKRVLEVRQSPALWMKAGDALVGANDTISAVKAYERAYAPDVRPLEMTARLADMHISLGHYDQAEIYNEHILGAIPEDPEAGLRAANIKRWGGDHEAAIEIERKFWTLHPEHAGLLSALLDDKQDDVLSAALAYIDSDQGIQDERRRLHFALARFYDRKKETDKAWQYASQANSLYADSLVYQNCQTYERQLDKAIKRWAELPQILEQSSKMIYIMGPPRSGGSLLQTILAQSANVQSVGERGALLSWLLPGLEDENLAQSLKSLAIADLAGMARAVGQSDIYVDKTSPHIIVAGLLSRIHFDARFIVPMRNPQDMAVSMFFHDFSPDFLYTRSIQGIADYLAFQDKAVAAWRSAGLDLIVHDHDAFIQSPHEKGRALFSALNLPWSSEVLNTKNTQNVVMTFSARQIRGGISQKYAGRGERYAEHLNEAGFE